MSVTRPDNPPLSELEGSEGSPQDERSIIEPSRNDNTANLIFIDIVIVNVGVLLWAIMTLYA